MIYQTRGQHNTNQIRTETLHIINNQGNHNINKQLNQQINMNNVTMNMQEINVFPMTMSSYINRKNKIQMTNFL